jgi:hypothetical protein
MICITGKRPIRALDLRPSALHYGAIAAFPGMRAAGGGLSANHTEIEGLKELHDTFESAFFEDQPGHYKTEKKKML